jgi:hypothetical protein
MKAFKKLAATLACGAALAAASAPASAAVSLIFYDEFFQEIGKISNTVAGGTTVSFDGTILGWRVTAVGGTTYQPDGITRLEMSGVQAFRRAGSFQCTSSGISQMGDATDVYAATLTMSAAYANTAACNATVAAAAGGYTNNIIRVRVEETAFAVPNPNPAKMVYSLTSSLIAPPTGGTVSGTVITGFDALAQTNSTTFGPAPLWTGNSLGGNFDSVTVASPNLYVQAGIDLIAGASFRDAAAMTAANGFSWNMDLRAVPEPGTLALLGVSLLGIAALRRRSASSQV